MDEYKDSPSTDMVNPNKLSHRIGHEMFQGWSFVKFVLAYCDLLGHCVLLTSDSP